ncbi:hypothetical protein ACLK19_15375 [Escherichia coli]
MSEGWNIAVLGVLAPWAKPCSETLAERQFPVGEIYALAQARMKAQANNCALVVRQSPCRMPLNRLDAGAAGIFVAGKEATAAWVEEATNPGCLVIHSSGLFALRPDAPLAVPEVNPFVLTDYRNRTSSPYQTVLDQRGWRH